MKPPMTANAKIINSIPISAAPRRETLSDISFILPLEESERVTAAKLTDEFDQRHLCCVTFSISKLEHPSVSPGTLYVSRSNLVEQTNGIEIQKLYTMELQPMDSEDDYLSMMRKNLEGLKIGLGC